MSSNLTLERWLFCLIKDRLLAMFHPDSKSYNSKAVPITGSINVYTNVSLYNFITVDLSFSCCYMYPSHYMTVMHG